MVPSTKTTASRKRVLRTITSVAVPLMKQRGVVKAGIFGSYARGEQKKESDVDILIQPRKGVGYFELIRLERELMLALGRKVDLVTYRSLHPLLRDRILNEEVRII